MPKSFYPETGYMVRNGAYWYDHRVLLTIDAGDRIDIFRRPYAGKPCLRLGSYGFEQLDPGDPPIGLRLVEADEPVFNPFAVYEGKRA
jgi:hypothetical protein